MKLTKEVKIGITAVLAVLIVYFGIIFLKGLRLFHTDNVYYVRMNNVNGLLVAGDVISNGLKVGAVKSMDYKQDTQEIIVAAEIIDGFVLPVGSRATIHKDLLGAPKLNLVLGPNPSDKLMSGDTIPGSSGAADLMSSVGEMVPDIKAMIPKVDSLITALNSLANDPALKASLYNIEGITEELENSSARLNEMMGSLNNEVPALVGKADRIMTNLTATTTQISQIDLKSMADKADQTLTSASATMQNVNDMTYSLTQRLNSRNSTLGRLLNDSSAYVHLDSTLQNASNLLLDFKEHPKRYVHFSLFGKKDE